MYRIYKTSFDAAHHIKDHKKCGCTHGHTYHLEVKMEILKEWYDFHLIACNVDEVVKQYDHHDMGNMTCEKLVEEIWVKLIRQFQSQPIKRIEIKLFETEHFGVEYP